MTLVWEVFFLLSSVQPVALQASLLLHEPHAWLHLGSDLSSWKAGLGLEFEVLCLRALCALVTDQFSVRHPKVKAFVRDGLDVE